METRTRAEEFLLTHGTDHLPHPGGTLFDHLRRVAATLAEWGAEETVQVAGLCHAAYGTDGFDQVLLDVTERATLAALIGADAEALVYLYGSCDRDAVYPLLGSPGPVPFRDRFSGKVAPAPEPSVRAFLEITAANELDVTAYNAELAAKYGPSLRRLFIRGRARLSDAAWQACVRQLGGDPDQG